MKEAIITIVLQAAAYATILVVVVCTVWYACDKYVSTEEPNKRRL